MNTTLRPRIGCGFSILASAALATAAAAALATTANASTPPALPGAPSVTMQLGQPLQANFRWTAVAGATQYQESVDGGAYQWVGDQLIGVEYAPLGTIFGLGEHTVSVEARNAAGWGAPGTAVFTVTPVVGTGVESVNGRFSSIGVQDFTSTPAPAAPGSVTAYGVRWVNAGTSAASFQFAQEGAGKNPVPASWVSFSQATAVLAPGGYADVTVTVTIPAGAAPGLYTGIAMGLGAQPKSGQLTNEVAAGMPEDIDVS